MDCTKYPKTELFAVLIVGKRVREYSFIETQGAEVTQSMDSF